MPVGEGKQELLGQLTEQSETPTRQLTLEEAVALAILLQKNEQLVEAQELYRRVLEMAPDRLGGAGEIFASKIVDLESARLAIHSCSEV